MIENFESNGAIEQQPQQEIQQSPEIQIKNVAQEPNDFSVYVFLFLDTSGKILLFIWYLLQSLVSLIYWKKNDIRNEYVLITGSGGSLGRKLACEFSKNGVTLILLDKDEDKNKETYNALRTLKHRRMYLYKVDLSNEAQVREIAAQIKSKFERISFIVHAAPIKPQFKSIFNFEKPEELSQAFRLQYESQLWLLQEFLPKMIELNKGHIITITNENVIKKQSGTSRFSSLKAAQIKFIECLDSELSANDYANNLHTSIVFLHDAWKQTTKGGENKVAEKIVDGIRKNRKYIYTSYTTVLMYILKSALPSACFELIYNNTEDSSLSKTTLAIKDK